MYPIQPTFLLQPFLLLVLSVKERDPHLQSLLFPLLPEVLFLLSQVLLHFALGLIGSDRGVVQHLLSVDGSAM